MRLGSLLSVAVSALLVSRECDATSPATKVLRTQNLIDNDIDNDIDIDIDNDRGAAIPRVSTMKSGG